MGEILLTPKIKSSKLNMIQMKYFFVIKIAHFFLLNICIDFNVYFFLIFYSLIKHIVIIFVTKSYIHNVFLIINNTEA